MKKIILMAAIIVSVGLAGCESMQGYGTKQTVGTAGGAVVGGILASNVGKGKGQLWATGAGALVGALLGSEIGKSLDRADMQYAQTATQQAYTSPVGQPISWNNPESGHYGTVTPVREGSDAYTGNVCREYQQTIYVGGQQESAYGTACQQSDGSWKIVS